MRTQDITNFKRLLGLLLTELNNYAVSVTVAVSWLLTLGLYSPLRSSPSRRRRRPTASCGRSRSASCSRSRRCSTYEHSPGRLRARIYLRSPHDTPFGVDSNLAARRCAQDAIAARRSQIRHKNARLRELQDVSQRSRAAGGWLGADDGAQSMASAQDTQATVPAKLARAQELVRTAPAREGLLRLTPARAAWCLDQGLR
jgi:hypothetical protein